MQALLALAIAIGSWLLVPGGTWQPGTEDIADVKAKLQPYVSEQAASLQKELSPWSTYTFQLQGRELDGRRLIYVNGFCSQPPDDADKKMVLVFDGGTCYFHAYYDVQTKEFVGIGFNGLA